MHTARLKRHRDRRADREISRICRDRGVPYLVDAAQTAGCVPIDLGKDPIDMLAFTGHKGLLGPTGTGGLVLSPSFDEKLIGPLVYGGTGSRSEQEYQPEFLPDRFESGTCNIAGIAGLSAGLDYILTRGLSEIRAHESGLVHRLIDGLEAMEGVTVYGTAGPGKKDGGGLVSDCRYRQRRHGAPPFRGI